MRGNGKGGSNTGVFSGVRSGSYMIVTGTIFLFYRTMSFFVISLKLNTVKMRE